MATTSRKRSAKSLEYAVPDEAAAYVADALMELALKFEATHFAQIRRHYQSITPTRGDDAPRQLDLFGEPALLNIRAILWFDPRREHSSVPTALSR